MSQEHSFKTITKHNLDPKTFEFNTPNQLISVKYPVAVNPDDLITGSYIQETWKPIWWGKASREHDSFTLEENIDGKEFIVGFKFDDTDIPDRCSGVQVAMHTAPTTHYGFKQIIKIGSSPNGSNSGLEIYLLEDQHNHNSKVFIYYNPKNVIILSIMVKEIALINPTRNIKTSRNKGALGFFKNEHIW